MKEPVSEAWLCDEALRIAGRLLDARMERDASVIHQLVRRVRQGSAPSDISAMESVASIWRQRLTAVEAAKDAHIAELEAELAMSRAANGELIAERLRGESATRIAELEAEVAQAHKIEGLALAQVKETTATLDLVSLERSELRAELAKVTRERDELLAIIAGPHEHQRLRLP